MEEFSIVTIVFNDGEVRDYPMSAGPGVSSYLADQAGRSGILHIRDGEESYSFPIRNIREWKVSRRSEDHGNQDRQSAN